MDVKSNKPRLLSIENEQIRLSIPFADATIRQVMYDNMASFDGTIQPDAPRTQTSWWIPLTESNILKSVRLLKRYNVEMSSEIVGLYTEISAIVAEGVSQQFSLDCIDPKSAQFKQLSNEIDLTNDTLVFDRQLRYQYKVLNRQLDNESLTSKLATRRNPMCFVDSAKAPISEVFASLRELERFPILIVIDEYNVSNSVELLESVIAEVSKNPASVGAYIRFDNTTESGRKFNSLIKEHELNQPLQLDTSIIIVSNSRLPKFIVSSGWYPRAVISVNNRFKHSKTSVYCNAVDLIVYHNSAPPLGIGLENELL
jgi:hypothetical protein